MFEAVCVCLSVLRLVYDRSMKTAMFCISLLLLKLISVGLRPEFKKSLKVSTVQKPVSRSLQLGKKKSTCRPEIVIIVYPTKAVLLIACPDELAVWLRMVRLFVPQGGLQKLTHHC